MATATKPSAREAHAKARGGQGPTSNTRINLSPASGTLLSLDGEVAGFAPDALSAARNAIARVPA